MNSLPNDGQVIRYSFDCLRAQQPIGDIYVCSIPHDKLRRITYFDVRRVLQEERDVERYLGIQRPLDKRRVEKIKEYVNFYDASFPTGIIVAIDENYAMYDLDNKCLTISNAKNNEDTQSINISNVARVLDGQHRIAGLEAFSGERFDLPVIVFIGADISDQAHIFSNVNLEQTKVNKSLVYDLYALARSRSPQKTCHNIAVALDQDDGGPLYTRIKRLGGATLGRTFEPISQATFVEALIKYISDNPKLDRDTVLRGGSLERVRGQEQFDLPFRNLFIDGNDLKIADAVNNLFLAVRERWPVAWADTRREGRTLNRTNAFKAIMRAFSTIYREHNAPGGVVPKDFILNYLSQVPLEDDDFNRDNFLPGSSGEGRLWRVLTGQEALEDEQ